MAISRDYSSCRKYLHGSSILIVKHLLVFSNDGGISNFQVFSLNFLTLSLNKCLFLDWHIQLIHGIIVDNCELRYVLIGTMYSRLYQLLTNETLSKAWEIRKEPDHKVLSYLWIVAFIVYHLYKKCKQYCLKHGPEAYWKF